MDMGKGEGGPRSLDNRLERKAMEARVADIRAEFKTEEAEVKKSIKQETLRQREVARTRGDG